MSRTKRGVVSRAKHKKVFRAVKGQIGRRKNSIHISRQEKENSEKRAPHTQYKALKDGGVEFKFKLINKVKKKDGTDFEQRPKILNSDKTVAEPTAVYNGSKMKIAFQMVSWANNLQGAGVTVISNLTSHYLETGVSA